MEKGPKHRREQHEQSGEKQDQPSFEKAIEGAKKRYPHLFPDELPKSESELKSMLRKGLPKQDSLDFAVFINTALINGFDYAEVPESMNRADVRRAVWNEVVREEEKDARKRLQELFSPMCEAFANQVLEHDEEDIEKYNSPEPAGSINFSYTAITKYKEIVKKLRTESKISRMEEEGKEGYEEFTQFMNTARSMDEYQRKNLVVTLKNQGKNMQRVVSGEVHDQLHLDRYDNYLFSSDLSHLRGHDVPNTIIIPYNNTGKERGYDKAFAKKLFQAQDVLMYEADEMFRGEHEGEVREEYDFEMKQHTARNDALSTFLEGIQSVTDALTLLMAQEWPRDWSYMQRVETIVEKRLIEKYAKIATVGWTGPMAETGTYVSDILQINKEGDVSFGKNFMRVLMRERRLTRKYKKEDFDDTRFNTLKSEEWDNTEGTIDDVLQENMSLKAHHKETFDNGETIYRSVQPSRKHRKGGGMGKKCPVADSAAGEKTGIQHISESLLHVLQKTSE